ncbi:zinc metallopeptidase [Chloroflexi bacterium TSY]|nr:zinc metallopeptidase [Chloroflexi bacterium TSY]
MFFFSPLYLLFMVPPLLLGLWAQMRVKGAFNKYSQVGSGRGISGANAARRILDAYGLQHVGVERTNGFLGDHYDPRSKTLRLSQQVYDSPSLAAVGVAAHEAGHALQDKESYGPLRLRSSLVPAAQFGSWLGPIIILGGFLLMNALGPGLAWLGVGVLAVTTLFTLVTLPVEFDASRRAKQLLVSEGILGSQELTGVNKVLDAAALTYVAAAVSAIMQLAYYAFLLLGRRE